MNFANEVLIQVETPVLIGCKGKILMKLRLYPPLFPNFPDSCTKLGYTVFESNGGVCKVD